MNRMFYKLSFLAFLALFLGACQNTGYNKELFKKSVEKFDAAVEKVPYSQNASLRFLSVAKDIKTFPDNEQSLEKYCSQGLPKRHGHITHWFDENAEILQLADETLKFEVYLLNYESLENEKRQDILNRLGRLWLSEALLYEVKEDLSGTLSSLKKVYRYSYLLTQDAFVDDFYLAWNFHRNADYIMQRVLPKLDEQELKYLLVFFEEHSRGIGSLKHYLMRKKQIAPILIQKYLKPKVEDSFLDRYSLASHNKLQNEVEEVLESQVNILSLDSHELFENDNWKSTRELLNEKIESSVFHRYFFGMRINNVTSFQRIHYYRSIMVMNNELRQFQVAWILLKKSIMASEITLDRIKEKIDSEHKNMKSKMRQMAFIDIFSGKDYGFRIEKYHTLIWSLGPDLKDTDGLFPWDAEKGKGDIILKLKH